MLKSIAYIGYGFVGKACHKAFEHNAEAIIIDPKYSTTTISDLVTLQPPLVFVAINAPTLTDNSVDAGVIYTVLQQLADIRYNGLVVLKSTIPPKTVADLEQKFLNTSLLRFIYSPEFLREAHWEEDALHPKQIILSGHFADCARMKEIYKKHSHVSPFVRFMIVDPETAALSKYAINCFLATKVIFMNQMYQLYNDIHGGAGHPENWKEFCELLENDTRIGFSHLKVPGPDGKFGYGGSCFPKDMAAMIGFDTNERMTLVREAAESNTQIRLTGALPSPDKSV